MSTHATRGASTPAARGSGAPEPVAEGSNGHFRFAVATAAPRQAVWRLWTDISQWPAWDLELERASLEGPLTQGAQGVLKGKDAPESRFEIIEHAQGQRYAFATGLPLGRLVITRYFQEGAPGTVFVHDVRFEGVGGWMLSHMLGPRYRKALPVVMGRIKDMAEAQAQVAP